MYVTTPILQAMRRGVGMMPGNMSDFEGASPGGGAAPNADPVSGPIIEDIDIGWNLTDSRNFNNILSSLKLY